MRDYIELGSAPAEEDCVQVSRTEDYYDAMRDECNRYRSLLEQKCPIPDGVNARYSIKKFQHDYKAANPKPKMRKDGTMSYKPYTLGQDSFECLDVLRLCNKRDISPEEEEQVKAYHLKYCIRGVDK